jgi:phage baseplate assembly protein W
MKIFKNVYSDIPMFFSKNSFTGDLNLKKDGIAIKESIKNLILTTEYERPFDSEFGTPVGNGLFDNPYDFAFYVENAIAAVITRYESRVELNSINSTFNNDKTVSVNIRYTIREFKLEDNIKLIVERAR